MIDVEKVRADFPILKDTINGYPLIYFDNAASTQKPEQVLETMDYFYRHEYANIARGVYPLAERATIAYEDARATVAHFINAESKELVFVCNSTHGINIVASSWGQNHIQAGDEIIVSELEHHSMLLPWQQLALRKNAILKFIPVHADGTLDYDAIPRLLSPSTKLVAISAVSNVIGCHVDLTRIIPAAHAVGAKVMVDAAQLAPNEPIDVKKMGADFLVFSAHKMLGPTGIGALFIKRELHEGMPPVAFGGGMVYHADFAHATWRDIPARFEAGTPPIAQAVGFAAAINYLQTRIEFDALKKYQALLCKKFIEGIKSLDRIKVLGPVQELERSGHLVSFTVEGIHAHDVAQYLGEYGVCVRAGHQCAQPLAHKLGIDASVRASFYCYNTLEEVEQAVGFIKKMLHDWR